jgi:hypothetical protein
VSLFDQLKWVHFEQDARGRDIELRYFRDTDRREVDFVVVEKRAPIFLVECKMISWYSFTSPSSSRLSKAPVRRHLSRDH